MNLYIIGGIRSQYIKIASMMFAIEKFNKAHPFELIRPIYINSGQHYDFELAGQYIKEFGIKFDVDFTKSYNDLTPIGLIGGMIKNLYNYLITQNPLDGVVIIFGDANTTLAGAIAASKAKFKIAHIEAGLRCGNIKQTEEQNRICADHLSDLRFATTKQDLKNLKKEGLAQNSTWVGDVLYDLVLNLSNDLEIPFDNIPNDYVLATLHREENILSDQIMSNVLVGLNNYRLPVIFIAHPRTFKRIIGLGLAYLPNILYKEAISYKKMLGAIKGARFVLTDSGGIQREAYYLGKRSLVRQDNPFWTDLISREINKKIGVSKSSVVHGFNWIEKSIEKPLPRLIDYGNGTAFDNIFLKLLDMDLS